MRTPRRTPPSTSPLEPGSLGEWLRFIGAEPQNPDWLPVWPPDAFAISAALLKRTGAYVGLVNGRQTRRPGTPRDYDRAAEAGRQWRETLDIAVAKGLRKQRLRDVCPANIKTWWRVIARAAKEPLEECTAPDDAAARSLVDAVVNLCIASDEASEGIGIDAGPEAEKTRHGPRSRASSNATGHFLSAALSVLESNGGRSFCLLIPPTKLAVLGKQHTPQRGCTIRSLTHNLSLYTPSEIEATWHSPYMSATGMPDVVNLLLLPWPVEVKPGDFRVPPATAIPGSRALDARVNRYFEYAPTTRDEPAARLVRRVATALDNAARAVDRIHGIVLPEMALTPAQFEALEQLAIDRRALIVTGLRDAPSVDANGMSVNACVIQPMGLTKAANAPQRDTHYLRQKMRCVQLKHHRWCLDRNQILQYELGGRLPASFDCWEHIYIGERRINFVTVGSWLTVCALICEDLARQDPVTDVIRAVGPNLVFALLMDGPQLKNRWPSRYASVLAEDPGSSVLSLTSLGMSKRSRPSLDSGPVVDRSRTVALWRDAAYGEREISMDQGHDACVLSLVCRTVEEFTIDGRGDRRQAHFPVFAGAFSFKSDERATRRRNRLQSR